MGCHVGDGRRIIVIVKKAEKQSGGQVGCERRIEVTVKMQKKSGGGGPMGGYGVGGSGRVGIMVYVNEELKSL